MNLTSVKIFAENVAEVRTLFQLRATCKSIKRVCDKRLVAIKPTIGINGRAYKNLLADLQFTRMLLGYVGLPCIFDRALKRLPRDTTIPFLAEYIEEVGSAVAAPSTVGLVCKLLKKEMFLSSKFAAKLRSDECLVEMRRNNMDVFTIGPEISQRLARITNVGWLRDDMLHGRVLESPFRDVRIVCENLRVILEEWEREDGSREFVPLDAAITMRNDYGAASGNYEHVAEEFAKANPKAFVRYVKSHFRSK